MTSVDISQRDRRAASELIASRPVYRGSHRKGAANEVGCLGEVVALRLLRDSGIDVVAEFATTHDFRLGSGATVEVKTKDRTVAPEPHFDCSVPDYVADHQAANFYLFVSLERERHVVEGLDRFHTAHFVGVASPAMLRSRGRLMDAGVTDVNGTTFWTACRNIAISELVPFSAVVHLWKKL